MTYTALRRILLTTALAVTAVASFAHAGPCKPNNQACATSQSCCSKLCVNALPPGKRFKGVCPTPCTPTTCSAQGATCGGIPDGCGGTLDCGTCTAPNTCGGGGT